MDYDAPFDLSAANENELDMARADISENGMPTTPAIWQRKFKWSYHKSLSALKQIQGS